MRAIFAGIVLAVFLTFSTEASAGFQHEWDVARYDQPRYGSRQRVKQVSRDRSYGVGSAYFDSPKKVIRGIGYTAGKLVGVATSALPSPLQNALHQVSASCAGFRVISAFRPGARIAGTGRPSLHASGRAADFVVRDYSCAYAILRNFPGGVSMDADRVGHIHVSHAPGSSEWGARFNHGGRAYAKRSKYRRYARSNGRRT